MQKKHFIYFIAFDILALICFAIYIDAGNLKNTHTEMAAFMRNLTWWTDLESFTPYQHNDELEYVFIAEPDTGNLATVSVAKLAETVDITEIRVNDVIKKQSELANIPFDTILKISIRGKAKTGNVQTGNIKDSIELSFTEGEKTEEAVPVAQVVLNTPEGMEFSDDSFSSNTDNLIIITGKNLETIEKIIIGEKSFSGIFREAKYYFTIPKSTFGNGAYFVGLYLRNGKLISTKEKFTFTFNPNPINISAITPNTMKNTADGYVVLQGNGFSKMISLQLSNNLIFQNALFTVVNDRVVSVKIPKDLKPGDYYFNMMDTAWIYEAKNMTIHISQ